MSLKNTARKTSRGVENRVKLGLNLRGLSRNQEIGSSV